MNVFAYFFICSQFFCYCFCWPTYENSNHTVPHRGHCFSLIPGVGAMKKGEYKTLTYICIMAMCDDDKYGTIYYHGCDTRPLPDTCRHLLPDLTKPYPDCCPYVDCAV
ncbi:hypothetical protein FQR65_LT00791 [Abscondita terminalis]|nr:hypothetical protein FQR65_LT00791 [Abscondita terminalis]